MDGREETSGQVWDGGAGSGVGGGDGVKWGYTGVIHFERKNKKVSERDK